MNIIKNILINIIRNIIIIKQGRWQEDKDLYSLVDVKQAKMTIKGQLSDEGENFEFLSFVDGPLFQDFVLKYYLLGV